MKQRLHKYIASCGYCSRRKAELLLQSGLVTVDGRKVEDLGFKVDPEKSVVAVNGEAITPPRSLTVILNKPEGFITSTHDTHERLTVMDLLPKSVLDQGVLPAGRLDFETEGLLVFTNDGDLQHRITHPRYTCPKVYRATLDREPTDRELEKLRKGVFLEEVGKKTAEAEVEMITAAGEKPPICQVRIAEGMKRQVRRMFETVRIRVVHLERRSIGGVELGELARGEWRALTDEEIRSLIPEE